MNPENLTIYEKVRTVPQEAQKPIAAGRLKGKTDINPMWRIKTLTEQFGPVGLGWYYTIDRTWLDAGGTGEVTAHVEISLYFKSGDTWSQPIKGLGGSMLVSNERNGKYTDDDCYKKALTDAISVACKALGIGADVYWNNDPSKYSSKQPKAPKLICRDCGKEVFAITGKSGKPVSPQALASISQKEFGQCLCADCLSKRRKAKEEPANEQHHPDWQIDE